ncbi:MAG: glutathione S-transferase family protein [Pseudomonadales bacterium]
MGVITPTNKEVLDYKDLHLFHAGASNCSMRVRMTLEEKQLPWTSHHLNILKKEHITPEYFGINPNGLVPTLVHDGTVIIESDDIIDYLDETFPNPPLKSYKDKDKEATYTWLHRATSIHLEAVKPYIYAKRIGKSMAHSSEEDEKYRQLQTNPDLLEFHRKSTQEGFSDDETSRAEGVLDKCFADMEQLLEKQEWLAGQQFSLADIAWVPLYFTLDKLAGYSFDKYPQVSSWTQRIGERDSYQQGVLNWWPVELGGVWQQDA